MTSTVPALGTRTAEGSALQAVLLDMDGTLVDTEGFWWDVEVEVFAALGHPLDESWRHVVVGGPMTRSAGFLIEATGAAITLAELAVLLNDGFEERIGQALPLMPGAARLLAELHEHAIPTALVSASHRRIIDRVLTVLGSHHFDLSVAGDEVSRTKPFPDPYLMAAARLGADPSRCAVVEDTATGVAAAEAAGCRVVAVPSVAPITPAAGRTVVPSLEAVDLAFLRGLMTEMR
ncbi:haloacid dehalogenase superfamily, subfamily IA, variant 3 with third motif having DD or ED [Streptomyces sp. 1222.5]|uniref:HAD family hydrolase n=1 Tax=unclassified Streptomyces TaxID=2593676 RepID=UPI00089C8EF6|nr:MULTISPECIES: HAD family phosphatase [unclassified Streptomyces]PKW06752.1 HAD superfamily hydrolase (TIGR01509 family) [Streptomyces sp. 5112.2]SEC64720.1 haloacid dehalogenase superfamily, subfamily IA, variant 3 with third motif having DD or ED [Streptomyces sp. 2231.1]SED05834.1 haloacid dehalogenase superfamily, subfamily IA, variant 3 with third motif having DD or ED [Streptomyces sp. 1222.5]